MVPRVQIRSRNAAMGTGSSRSRGARIDRAERYMAVGRTLSEKRSEFDYR
ncbi:hypothetical protein V0288_22105 [Pannus brasiliensis CCIBt3594]|uniref:Uncharacterized protein n=1 Tax=Pannus brasiliensis CCIBt3594 TaxID=1427578 RepID=A0AAW9R0M6_9CHRO